MEGLVTARFALGFDASGMLEKPGPTLRNANGGFPEEQMKSDLHRRQFLSAALAGAAVSCAAPLCVGADDAAEKEKPRCWRDSHFVMDNWFYKTKLKPVDRVKIVKDLGYTGITCSVSRPNNRKQFPEVLSAMDQAGLALTGVNVGIFIHDDPHARGLQKLVDSIADRDALVMLEMRSRKDKRSQKTGDARAKEVLLRMSDLCETAHIMGVAMYPAVGNWLERISHSVKLSRMVKRPNVGTMFNQYHWMRIERKMGLERTVKMAAPYLKCVTVNGSNDAKPNIMPLGQGDFNTLDVIKLLARAGYKHEIGVSGQWASGDVKKKLASSMATWRKYCAAVK